MDNDGLLAKIINSPTSLSNSQRDAVLSENEHIRIIAGAGAGKTETLTRKIVYLLLYKKVKPSSIVAFTFTDKAAQGMKSRIYDRVQLLGSAEISAHLGEMYIGTIHGYCSFLLETYFKFGNYGVLDENQETAFILRVGWELGLGKTGNYTQNCRTFLTNLNVVYGELISEEKLKKNADEFYSCFKRYEEILDRHKRLTFNRMVNLTLQHLQEKTDVLSYVKYLIVDEYQDINRAQERLIKLIGENASIFIVGDPRQTIYQWRGSDERCFEDFAKFYECAETIPITENRRSGRQIIGVANHFSDFFEQKYDHLDHVRIEEGAVYIVEHSDEAQEAKWIADQIEKYVNSKKCSYGDIGILFRSVNTSAPPFIDVFRQRSIPFIVGGKVGLFRRPEIQTVGKLFAWLYENGFWYKNQWSRDNQEEGDELLNSALEDWKTGVLSCNLHNDIVKQLEVWKEKVLDSKYESFTEVYHELLVLLNYLNLNPHDSNDAVIMANLGRFSSLLTDFESANMLGGRRRSWERDLKNLCWYINSYATGSYEEQSGDDIRGINAVQLMTVHQAKGLEWSLVFVPAMNKMRFPSSMVGREQRWLIPRDMFDANKYEGDIESEKKLFYVSLTRAKEVLVVSYFRTLNGRNSAVSVFVSEGLRKPKITMLSSRDDLPFHDLIKSSISEEILTYTASEIIQYQKCPYLYRLNQIWGYEPGFKERIGYGNTLHFCLQQAADLIKNDGYSPISAISTSIDENFYMPFVDKIQGEEIKEAAKNKLISFVKKYESDMYKIREVETRIEFPLQKATIAGKIDVIIHDGDSLEVRDYKTSDSVTTDSESAMQIQLYSYGLKMLGENVTKGSVAYLSDARVSVVEVDDSKLEETRRKAEKHIEKIRSGDFNPCRGEFCGICNFATICRWKKGDISNLESLIKNNRLSEKSIDAIPDYSETIQQFDGTNINERQNKQKEIENRLKQEMEEISRQREEKELKLRENNARREWEEQERLRRQKEEAEKRKAREEVDSWIEEQEKKKQEELSRQREEEERKKKEIEEEERKQRAEEEERESLRGQKAEAEKLEESKRKAQEELSRQREEEERQKKEKDALERKQLEDEERKRREEEKVRKDWEEQERLRGQRAEAEKLEESERKAQEVERWIAEQEKKNQEEPRKQRTEEERLKKGDEEKASEQKSRFPLLQSLSKKLGNILKKVR